MHTTKKEYKNGFLDETKEAEFIPVEEIIFKGKNSCVYSEKNIRVGNKKDK